MNYREREPFEIRCAGCGALWAGYGAVCNICQVSRSIESSSYNSVKGGSSTSPWFVFFIVLFTVYAFTNVSTIMRFLAFLIKPFI